MEKTIIIDTPAAFDRFRAIVIKSALSIHIRTNGQMRANRAYTPTRVLAAAGEITGKKYKRGQQQAAHDDIAALLEAS